MTNENDKIAHQQQKLWFSFYTAKTNNLGLQNGHVMCSISENIKKLIRSPAKLQIED